MQFYIMLISLIFASQINANEVRLISVVGEAKKSFDPDIVRLNIIVWGKGESAKKAQDEAVLQYELLKKAVADFKVKKEDIQTTSYDLNPEHVYDQKTNRNLINGYSVNQGLVVILRKITDAGLFLDSLTTHSKTLRSGINIQSLSFDLDKRSEEENKLMSKAVENAYEQAQYLANAAKVKIKGLYRLSPNNGSGPLPSRRAEMMAFAGSVSKSQAPELASGEIKVQSEVVAEYLIE